MSQLREPVLVTGAGGFIGRRTVARLLAAGSATSALLLPEEAAPAEWAGRVSILRGDVRNPESLRAAFSGVETIFHLAALVAEAGADYEAHWEVTADGSRNVYRAASEVAARVVVTTSICAYGDRIANDACREDSERGAHQGPYGRAKQAQEDFALEAHANDGLAVSLLRPSNVYGAGSRPWVQLLGAALQQGQMIVVGDGSGNAGLVHVENVVDALMLVAASERAIGRIYNVCDGLDVSWRRYLDDLARMLDVPSPPSVPRKTLYAAAIANEDPATLQGQQNEAVPSLEFLNLVGSDNRVDTTRIREELAWNPEVGYEAALAEIAEELKPAAR